VSFSVVSLSGITNASLTCNRILRRYGNPENPLEGFGDVEHLSGHLGSATTAPKSMKLDKAAEAIRVLDETREFWSDTWGQAKPIPAVEQEILFDAANTLEITLDYLETIHPATLLCQVMAVNLAMAYFTLVVAAGDAVRVGVVRTSFVRFRESVVLALERLSHDATFGDSTLPQHSSQRQRKGMHHMDMLVSIESLSVCGKACLIMSETEVLMSRATSLLYKLPQQYTLVDKILSRPNGTPIEVSDKKVRSTILKLSAESKSRDGIGRSIPTPSIREYKLMNEDDSRPCQLYVRYFDEGGVEDGEDCVDLIVALTKTM
jgi:hypothetical protein